MLALLVLGPTRIPEAAASLGKAIRSFRRATRELRDQIEIEEHVRRPFEDLKAALRDEPVHAPPYYGGAASSPELLAPAVPVPPPVPSPPAEAPIPATPHAETTAAPEPPEPTASPAPKAPATPPEPAQR